MTGDGVKKILQLVLTNRVVVAENSSPLKKRRIFIVNPNNRSQGVELLIFEGRHTMYCVMHSLALTHLFNNGGISRKPNSVRWDSLQLENC